MAGDVHVADRVEDLVLDELVVVAQAAAVQHAWSSTTIALSMLPPSARPRERIMSTSLVKPKVRARAMSRLYCAGAHVELDALAGLVDGRVVEVDLEAELVALVRLEARPHQAAPSPSRTSTGLQHAHEALGRVLQLDAGALQQEHEAMPPSRRGSAPLRR